MLELGEGGQFGRADEREVARVEEEDEPALALAVETEGDGLDLTAAIRLELDLRGGGSDLDVHARSFDWVQVVRRRYAYRCPFGIEPRSGRRRRGDDLAGGSVRREDEPALVRTDEASGAWLKPGTGTFS